MKISIETQKPIAIDSPDHINPFGALHNNTSNKNFNNKLYKLLSNKPLYITDWGCAGGGFIKDCIEDGHIGIGLEGSNCRQLNNLPEWNTIPNNLFTCDITSPFKILCNEQLIQFDVITLWDVMEHIKEEDLPTLFDNIKKHIKDDGLIILSINVASEKHRAEMNPNDFGPGKHHQNIQSLEWWDNMFASTGLKKDSKLTNYFTPDWIRGPGQGCDIYATEKRYNIPTLPVSLQWATINRVLRIN